MIAGRNRAGWWSLALGFAVTTAAAAQTPSVPAAPSRAPATAAAADNPLEVLARLSEIKVELAWLADPATFVCPLKVRVRRDTMLQVSGTVPSAEVRARALELASHNSRIAVLDTLTVGRVTAPKIVEKKASQLNLAATQVLKERGLPGLRDLKVQAQFDGVIVLLGSAGSYEEKLLASQRVRRVAGCRSVDNRLEVRLLSGPEGVTRCAVTADGRMTVAMATPMAVATAPPSPPAAPMAGPATPAVPPVVVTVARRADHVPTSPTIIPVSAAVKPTPRLDVPVPRALFEARPEPGFMVKPLVLRTTEVAVPAPIILARCSLPLAEPRKLSPDAPASAEIPCVVAAPTGADVKATAEEARPTTNETPTGADVTAEEASPTTNETPTAAEAPIAAETGLEEGACPENTETPASGSLAEWYRQRIARECALDLNCVFVTFPAPTEMTVTLRMIDRAAAGRASTRVTCIPELAPYHVKIDVDASPRP